MESFGKGGQKVVSDEVEWFMISLYSYGQEPVSSYTQTLQRVISP